MQALLPAADEASYVPGTRRVARMSPRLLRLHAREAPRAGRPLGAPGPQQRPLEKVREAPVCWTVSYLRDLRGLKQAGFAGP